ncbi:CaiF/GrlA family transcriptional regulator [Salmonella enterica]|nr:CaiF/GrlA family transcriptional regulator [Salmonella enterica]
MTVTVNAMKDDTQHTPLWGNSICTTYDADSTSTESVGHLEQKPLKKRVNQSNHESYVIPQSLSQYAQEPLYLLIALWCQAQARWVDRNEISAAFHLTARRASYQMSYISCKKQSITCRTRRVACENSRHRRNELYVESVTIINKTSESSPLTRLKQNPESNPQEENGRHNLQVGPDERDDASSCRWPLSRPSGEDE